MRQRSANSGAFLNEATRPLILIVAVHGHRTPVSCMAGFLSCHGITPVYWIN